MAETIIVNLREALAAAEGGFEDPLRRYNGGWTKTITELDKSHDNGYSLVGGFIKKETVQAHQTPGLYLDCDIGGSRKNQVKYYTLFELKVDGTARVLETLSERAGRTSDWAIKLWPAVETYFAEKAAGKEIPSLSPAPTFEQLKAVADAADALQKLLSHDRTFREAVYVVPGFDEALCKLESALDEAGYDDSEEICSKVEVAAAN